MRWASLLWVCGNGGGDAGGWLVMVCNGLVGWCCEMMTVV